MDNPNIKTVLIVDDEEAYLLLTERFFEKQGYICEAVTSAGAALELLSRQKFNLMLADIVMSGKDGLQLVREALQIDANLPCIMMTGHAPAYAFSDIIACGAADFIMKPFEFAELEAKIERIDRERQIQHQLRQANSALAWEATINASVSELSRVLMTPLPIAKIATLVLEEMLKLTGSRIGFLAFRGQSSNQPMAFSLCDKTAGANEDTCLDGCQALKELCHAALDHPHPVLANSPDKTSILTSSKNSASPVTRMISAPIMVNSTVLGQIAVANAQTEYIDKDLSTATRLATVFALGLEHRRASEELRNTKEYLESVFENASEAIVIVDVQGHAVKWNKAAAHMLGYTMDELQGKSIIQLYASSEQLERMLTQLRQEGFVRRYEADIRKKDGQIVPSELSVTVIKDDQGKVMGSITVALDLSEIKQAMARIQEINARLKKEIKRRKGTEKALLAARAELEKLVEERTAKLSRAGELLKRSLTAFKDVGDL